MNLELDKNLKYVFIKEKYFEDVLKTQGKLTTIEKNFGHKYDKKRIKVVNQKSGLVDGKFYVSLNKKKDDKLILFLCKLFS